MTMDWSDPQQQVAIVKVQIRDIYHRNMVKCSVFEVVCFFVLEHVPELLDLISLHFLVLQLFTPQLRRSHTKR